MKHSLILIPVFALALSGVASAHELKGDITVNKFGSPYSGCVSEGSKKVERDLAVRWCVCVFEQMGLHDYENRPGQGIFLPFSKHSGHAVELCKARQDRGEL